MLLILAKADTYHFLNQVRRITSIDDVYKAYGYSSILTLACEKVFNYGIKSLYVCNVQTDRDYIEVVNQIKTLDLSYIILPGARLDHTLLLKDQRTLPLSLVLSEMMPDKRFIITDYHASHFKSMTHFLAHYNKMRSLLERNTIYRQNLTFVANHLIDSDDACVDVACALTLAEIGDYPQLKCGATYFNLEPEDFRLPIVYFKNEMALNLFNLASGIESNLIVQRMVNTLQKEILSSLEPFIGTHFTPNTLFTVESKITFILNAKKEHYYKHYLIDDIIIEDRVIRTFIRVYPFFSKDAIKVELLTESRLSV